ncbi:nuclear transport factor 2-like [Juglans regia]|nr:nuclear transport factor 2-like [Juglans regia]
MSLNLTAMEIQTTNSLYSNHGGVLVVVSGIVKIRGSSKKRKFVQIIFLIPLGDGYLILSDIFQFINDDASTYQNQAPIPLGGTFDTQLNSSSSLPEPHALDFVWGQEMHGFVDEVLREDDPVGECSLAQQQQQEDYGIETAGETSVGENVSASFQSMVNAMHEGPLAPAMEERVGEAPKKTYASVLRGSKGQPGPSFSARPYLKRSSPATSEWNHTPQPAAQHSNSTLSFVPQASVDAVESLHGNSPATSERNQTPQPAAQHSSSTLSLVPQAGVDAVDEGLPVEKEGEPKSVYVTNLPPTVAKKKIRKKFKTFGQIIPNGILIRSQNESCYAMVEFEDLISVQNALEASPIQMAGSEVYIIRKMPVESSTYQAGRRGRGRGRGRGSDQMVVTGGRFELLGCYTGDD